MNSMRLDRLEAQIPDHFDEQMTRLAKAFRSSDVRAIRRFHRHPAWASTGPGLSTKDKRSLAYALATLDSTQMSETASKIAEYFVDLIADHEHAEPACENCRGEKPIREAPQCAAG